MVESYWLIGQQIVEHEQHGEARSDYGKGLLKALTVRLSTDFGKGFDERELRKMRQFYQTFQKRDTLRRELTWSHYRRLISVENEAARLWYMNDAAYTKGMTPLCTIILLLHLIHAAHAVGFHRGDGLAEQDEVEAGEGLDGWMVGNVAVYLLLGFGAQGIVVAGHETAFIDKGDMPEGHVADDVMLHGCGLILLDAGDAGRKGLVGIFANAHHSPREIYVFKVILHSCCGLEAVLFCVTCTLAFVL